MELLKNYCALQEMVIHCKFDIDYNVFIILYMNFCEITCTSKDLILFFELLPLKSANKTKIIP